MTNTMFTFYSPNSDHLALYGGYCFSMYTTIKLVSKDSWI